MQATSGRRPGVCGGGTQLSSFRLPWGQRWRGGSVQPGRWVGTEALGALCDLSGQPAGVRQELGPGLASAHSRAPGVNQSHQRGSSLIKVQG